MLILMVNLIIVTVFSYLATITKKRKIYSIYFAFISTVSLCVVSGFRYNVGTDYMAYYWGYLTVSQKNILETNDIGFSVLSQLLNIFSNNPQILFFITSILINVCIVIFLYKNSSCFYMSMYFYITMFIYYSSMNGIRQFIAVGIIVLGYKHIIDRNFKNYLIYILLASLFHGSALIMVPIYFIVNHSIYSKINLYIIGGAILIYIFFNPVFKGIMTILKGTRYSIYSEDIFVIGQGVNILRVLAWLAPVIFMFIFLYKSKYKNNKEVNIITNLCLIGALVMVLAYKHMYIARFCIYLDLYYLLLLPNICKRFDKKTNFISTVAIFSAYFIFSFLLLKAGEHRILPFEFNFNLF